MFIYIVVWVIMILLRVISSSLAMVTLDLFKHKPLAFVTSGILVSPLLRPMVGLALVMDGGTIFVLVARSLIPLPWSLFLLYF